MFHRDFKTPNILVTSDWRGKVCDFGFTIWGNSPARLETCAGTEEFMAPEMENGEDFGLPADIFSVGITICEVAAKRRCVCVRTPIDARDADSFDGTSRADGCRCACFI